MADSSAQAPQLTAPFEIVRGLNVVAVVDDRAHARFPERPAHVVADRLEIADAPDLEIVEAGLAAHNEPIVQRLLPEDRDFWHPALECGSKVRVPKLPDGVHEAMQRAAVTAFQALGLRDYARLDFRLARDGKVYLIEANPNPYLHSGAEFIKGARASGRTYAQTILEIEELARARSAGRRVP